MPGIEINGSTSDGYHTFDELYEHRFVLWIALCRKTAATTREQWNPTWRSKFNGDGSHYEGWFLLGMFSEPGHQITYHLPLSRWDECGFARTLEKGQEFDGHTSADVLERIGRL